MRLIKLILIFFSINLFSQNIDLNNDYYYSLLRSSVLSGDITTNYSFNIRPLNFNHFSGNLNTPFKTIYSNNNKTINVKTLGLDYYVEYNTNHPYNRNNGTMIPNRGYQHVFSPGLFLKLGPLEIQLKPEHHFSENKEFDGFWEGHYPEIWAKRYRLWNRIDMPERFGSQNFNRITFGQSSIKLNWKSISLGVSNENIWWGPGIRNSIMMSNHAEGFLHLSFNSIKPVKTIIGEFEWQFITGKLENSGFTPPRTDFEYAGTKLYVPKINQRKETDDWRFLQGIIISFSPKLVDGLSLGFIRWVQYYGAMFEGRYWWIEGKPSIFPVFQNLLRKNDKNIDFEKQTDQAAGIFLRWLWKDSKAEFYTEFHHNDSKLNIRDFLLDSDHSRAVTFGLQKVFNINKSNWLFNWEWTQMEQTASRLIRNAKSWYEHNWVFDGYTNKGEVLGSSIGPGSNSHYFSINRINNQEKIGIGFEVIDHDNDFFHEAFSSAKDFRRYWKDFNFHINYNKGFKNFNLSSKIVFIRSLNYQWELDDTTQPYYHNGRDVNNLHLSFKLTYFGTW